MSRVPAHRHSHDATATPTRCTRPTTRRASRRSTRRASSRSTIASTSVPRRTVPVLRLLGNAASTPSTSTARTASSRWSARRWWRRRTAHATSTGASPWERAGRVGPAPTASSEYLAATPITSVDDAVLDDRRRPAPRGARRATPVAELGAWIRDHVRVRAGHHRRVDHRGRGPRAHGSGVCQDFAHLALAVLRAAGIPARYVSGYLYPDTEGLIGETHAGESHAWIEAWIGDWQPFDPTSGPRSASATWSWRAAATTPTWRRSRACTTADRVSRSTCRWSSPASREPKRLARTRSMRQNVWRMTAHHSILVVT